MLIVTAMSSTSPKLITPSGRLDTGQSTTYVIIPSIATNPNNGLHRTVQLSYVQSSISIIRIMGVSSLHDPDKTMSVKYASDSKSL